MQGKPRPESATRPIRVGSANAANAALKAKEAAARAQMSAEMAGKVLEDVPVNTADQFAKTKAKRFRKTQNSTQQGGAVFCEKSPEEKVASKKQRSLANPTIDVACAILSFCDWPDRFRTIHLNRHWCFTIFEKDAAWRQMCDLLHCQNHVYTPTVCISESWQKLFKEQWPTRLRYTPSKPEISNVCTSAAEYLERTAAGETDLQVIPGWKAQPKSYNFQIGVIARFRPLGPSNSVADPTSEEARQIHLPLHQRIQLLRTKHNCSTEDAMKMLFGPTKGFFDEADVAALDQDKLDKGKEVAADESNEKTEVKENTAEAGVASLTSQSVVMCAPGVGFREFNCFDAVHGHQASQAIIYEDAGRRQVMEFINGLNCTILCYGQTGSGKTYTLFGPDAATSCSLDLTESSGIVPRACSEVLDTIKLRRSNGVSCTLQMSYVEVFGEEVSDLLKGESVGAWRGTAARAVLEGHAQVEVDSKEDIQKLLQKGESSKRRAATMMNERSSRAHALLFMTLTQKAGDTDIVSTLCMTDLGGCEQLKKSGAKGDRVNEAININSGLLALKQCITRLNDKAAYIPYQDSKLTMLLSPALGGDCKTVVVVSGRMEPEHTGETIQALRFGEKCAVVTNEAKNKSSCIAGLIAQLDKEIAETRAEIQAKERWESIQVRVGYDEYEKKEEIVTQSALVGAEAEQARLEELLRRRRELLGEEPAPEPQPEPEAEPQMETTAAPMAGVEGDEEKPKAMPARFKARMMKAAVVEDKAAKVAEKAAKAAEREEQAKKRRAEMMQERQSKARRHQEAVRQIQQMKAAQAAENPPAENQDDTLVMENGRRVDARQRFGADQPISQQQRTQIQVEAEQQSKE